MSRTVLADRTPRTATVLVRGEEREPADRAAPSSLWETIIDAGALAARGLTAREIDVLREVARGRTNHGVALALSVRPRTVQKHLERIHEKLMVGTRSAAVARAIELSAAMRRVA